jgi:hypothetical protein
MMMEMNVFCDVARLRLVSSYRSFEETLCLPFHGLAVQGLSSYRFALPRRRRRYPAPKYRQYHPADKAIQPRIIESSAIVVFPNASFMLLEFL